MTLATVAATTGARFALAPLKGRFTTAARQRIKTFLHSFESFEPTLALLYSSQSPDGPSWSAVAYGPQTVDDLLGMYTGFGAVVSYELDGFRVVIPQLAHLDDLDSGELDFSGDRIRRVQPAGA